MYNPVGEKMMINKISAVYFSPAGNAEKIARTIADRIGTKMDCPVEYIDFTLPEKRKNMICFSRNDLVVFCVPVYAGRVPNKILPYVQTLFEGNRTFVVPVVTFGNRNYDNALKELCFELDKKGFLAVGAAAVVAEHSFSGKLAAGRPNEDDVFMLQDFADAVSEKIVMADKKKTSGTNSLDRCPLDIDAIPGQWPAEKYYTPLGVDGQPAKFLKAKPRTTDECNLCGICAKNCPMGSINMENPKLVDGICIKCQACIKKCPKDEKYFDDEAFLSHVKMLEDNYSRPTESNMFI